jgi:transposase-like protein
VHAVAQRHGVNTSQLFTWRKRFRTDLGLPAIERTVPAFAAVELAPVPGASAIAGEWPGSGLGSRGHDFNPAR